MSYFAKFISLTNKGEFEFLLSCKSSVYALLPWASTVHHNAADGLHAFYRFGLEKKFTDTTFTSL